MGFNLHCQPCGKVTAIDGPDPTWAGDIAQAAHVAGWKVFIADTSIVVFCSDACCRAAITKRGTFRRDLGRDRMKAAHASA